MKFSFDKHTKEEPKNENIELTQEQFDEQIFAETEKLNTSLEQMKKEIDKFGGPEEFKKHFEQEVNQAGNSVFPPNKSNINKAGYEIDSLSDSLKEGKGDLKRYLKFTAIAVAVTVALDALLHNQAGF